MLKNNFSSHFGINVIGYVSANFGLGVTARSFISLFERLGIPVCALDIQASLERSNADTCFSDKCMEHAKDLPYAINFIILGIDSFSGFMLYPPPGLIREDRVNIGLVWWELPYLSKRLQLALQLLDIIVVGSEYVAETFLRCLSNVHVIVAKHPVYLPSNISTSREKFGLPKTSCIFITSFDPASDSKRKNPSAVVRAFKQAFPDEENVYLVVKANTKKNSANPFITQAMNSLRNIVADDSRIKIISDSLSYTDVIGLYANADVYVSLHRAEGLGLGPLETMGLGIPVIMTGWSGVRSYGNYANACLVTYNLVPVIASLENYKSEAAQVRNFWADPDVNHAASWMRALAMNPDLRKTYGQLGKQAFANYQQKAEEASWIEEIKAILYATEFLPSEHKNNTALRKMLLDMEMRKEFSFWRYQWKKITLFFERHISWRFKSPDSSR